MIVGVVGGSGEKDADEASFFMSFVF